MEAWYLSEDRFQKRIIKRWKKSGFQYNAGHINILRYAYRTVMFWATLNGEKVSESNKVSIELRLF